MYTTIIYRLPQIFFISVTASIAAILSYKSHDVAEQTKIVESGIVTKIHDGDTISVSVTRNYNIRLLDCWAPEIVGKEKQLGLQSKAALESMLHIGDAVTIEIPTKNNQPETSFDRTLAYILKDINGDGSVENISLEMVKRGHAKNKK
jgi:endonuclease YncB( thermonuclease family)